MDLFAALRAFTTAVERGAFSRAGDAMGLSTSSITRQIDALEEHLGVLLLNRSTRKLTLTDAGERYLDQVQKILSELDEANRSVGDRVGAPRGILRVNVPLVFSQLHIAPMLSKFLKTYPELELEIDSTETHVNLVEERVDLAIRLGTVDASGLIARRLAPMRRVVVASPDYLERRGAPQTPADLADHECCIFPYSNGGHTWHFTKDGAEETIKVAGPLKSNNIVILRQLAVAGHGLILVPTWLVGRDISSGRLGSVLN
jgi:DNA-binding transcriptional LysR family regulator